MLIQFCKSKLEEKHFDYLIFGHRHLPIEFDLNENSKYINIGDWISYFSYGVLDENGFKLEYFEQDNK